MADIFISYARRDRDRVKPLCERLNSLGYSVCWEVRDINEAENEIAAARACLVLWSAHARASLDVCAHTALASDLTKLAHAQLERTAPPLPFAHDDVADLSGDKPEFGPLEDKLARLVRDQGKTIPVRRSLPGVFATPPAAGAPKLVALATTLTLTAAAGALSAAQNGVMAPLQMQVIETGVLVVGAMCAAICLYRFAAMGRDGAAE